MKLKNQRDSKHAKDLTHCCWFEPAGDLVKGSARILRKWGMLRVATSKEMGTSALQIQGNEFCNNLNDLGNGVSPEAQDSSPGQRTPWCQPSESWGKENNRVNPDF